MYFYDIIYYLRRGICSNGFIDLIVKMKNRQERNTDVRLDAEKYVLMLLKTYCIDR